MWQHLDSFKWRIIQLLAQLVHESIGLVEIHAWHQQGELLASIAKSGNGSTRCFAKQKISEQGQ